MKLYGAETLETIIFPTWKMILLDKAPRWPHRGCPELKLGEIYEVEKIKLFSNGEPMYWVKDYGTCWLHADRLRGATPEEVEAQRGIIEARRTGII